MPCPPFLFLCLYMLGCYVWIESVLLSYSRKPIIFGKMQIPWYDHRFAPKPSLVDLSHSTQSYVLAILATLISFMISVGRYSSWLWDFKFFHALFIHHSLFLIIYLPVQKIQPPPWSSTKNSTLIWPFNQTRPLWCMRCRALVENATLNPATSPIYACLLIPSTHPLPY